MPKSPRTKKIEKEVPDHEELIENAGEETYVMIMKHETWPLERVGYSFCYQVIMCFLSLSKLEKIIAYTYVIHWDVLIVARLINITITLSTDFLW